MNSARLQCVVVVYRCTLNESLTVQSLTACFGHTSGFTEQLSVLIYDNSPTPQRIDGLNQRLGQIEYHHNAANGGLASAYNHALALAQQKGIDWLLLLDQDTVVEMELLSTLMRHIAAQPRGEICAMVPKLVQRQSVLSPQIVGRFRNYSVKPILSGVAALPVTALNSGACLRVTSVVRIGGFPQEYWLEYLDHIMFSRLQADGGRVLILDVVMEHQLSLGNLEAEMSLARYANVLAAEWRFVRETGWGSGSLVHRLRLLKRALFHTLRLRDKRYALQVLRSALCANNAGAVTPGNLGN